MNVRRYCGSIRNHTGFEQRLCHFVPFATAVVSIGKPVGILELTILSGIWRSSGRSKGTSKADLIRVADTQRRHLVRSTYNSGYPPSRNASAGFDSRFQSVARRFPRRAGSLMTSVQPTKSCGWEVMAAIRLYACPSLLSVPGSIANAKRDDGESPRVTLPRPAGRV